MSKLTAKQRRGLSSAQFGMPEQRRFPMPDKNHARFALAMIHHAPASAQPAIRAKARRILGK